MRDGQLLQTGSPQELHDNPAHEYVGYFIGSPGMNLVPAQVVQDHLLCVGVKLGAWQQMQGQGQGQDYRVGFRDRWVSLLSPDQLGLPAKVLSSRLLGTTQGEPQASYLLQMGETQVRVLSKAGLATGDLVSVHLERYLVFQGGQRCAFQHGES